MSRALGWWRHAPLAGAAAGLLAAPAATPPPGWLACAIAAAIALAAVGRSLLAAPDPAPAAVAGWLASLACTGALVGLGVGGERLAAVDGGALAGPVGAEVRVRGFVTAPPRRSYGEVRVPLDTGDGRLLVIAREPVPRLAVGSELAAAGHLTRPGSDFSRDEASRAGARLVLDARSVRGSGGVRGGVAGVLDGIRIRAERGLGEGIDPEGAALARGFVLGQDDLIDPGVREDFRRSGLAHLLAVSGQNVMLLAILAGVVMGLFGVGLRMRLALTLGLIAAYVPIAGAGPSIQRAGVMGAAAIVATLLSRPGDRAHAGLLAVVATLLIDPRASADVGWQLSFAAVAGIMLWASPLRALAAERLARRLPARLAAPLAEGIALTLAATAATAPLMAHHFEELSLASLPANLAVLPAIAPVMWLGMAIALLAQLPLVSTAPLGAVEGVLIDYVATVARVLGSPEWATVPLPSPGAWTLFAAYAAIVLASFACLGQARRRRALTARPALILAASALALAGLVAAGFGERADGPQGTPGSLRVTALDVGQGDATLLLPPRGDGVLVDGGPPGDAAANALREAGVERLAAVFLTHDDLDHSGGLPAVLASVRVGRLVLAAPAPEAVAAARAARVPVVRTAEGAGFELGPLSLDVLWPPRSGSPTAAEEPNVRSVVLRATHRGYDVLLTGDAESEVTHLDPGPIDVLKVAHHGSDDAGLEALLDRSAPRAALIEVGADNAYGHPTSSTLAALESRGVCVLRTDLDGTSTIEVGPAGVRAWTGEGAVPAARPGCDG